MNEIELHSGTAFCSYTELNRLARQQELSVEIARASIYDQICNVIKLEEKTEARLIQNYLQEKSIDNDSEYESYLKLRGWSEEDLIYVATKVERLSRFRHQVFSQEVELNYLGRKIDIDQVSYSIISVQDADLAFELHQQLNENEVNLEELALKHPGAPDPRLASGRHGPHAISRAHPALIDRLRVGQPDQLWPPFFDQETWIVLRLDQRQGLPLDESVREVLLDDAFETWMQQRISQILTGMEPPELPTNFLSSLTATDDREDTPDDIDPLNKQIQDIAGLIQSDQASAACEAAIQLMDSKPNNRDVLLIAHTAHRSAGQHHKALKIAKQIIKNEPEYFDGYARAAQEFLVLKEPLQALQIIADGRAHGADHPWLLITGLRASIQANRYSKAQEFGKVLHQNNPEFIDFYEPFLHALVHNGHAKRACNVALDALEKYPEDIRVITNATRALMRSSRLEQCRWQLYRSIQNISSRREVRFLTEEIYHIESQLRQNRSTTNRVDGCDVIAIAANEAPYIHEFIHHYIFLGFRNIFIGINNCTDNTLAILEKIREIHEQVFIVDVNNVIKPFMQWGCYHRLFDIAFDSSDSKHCLIVDIDEFWVADPFPKSIGAFLNDQPPFDALSFHWVDALDDILFDLPLSRSAAYNSNPWVKSLIDYSVPLARIGVHGPILNKNQDDATVRLGKSINVNTNETLHGIEVLGRSPELSASTFEMEQQAWVIHRANRSELEYASRLFRTHANEERQDITLKSNRYGWTSAASQTSDGTDYFRRIISEKDLNNYHQSLESFIGECEIDADIKAARSELSEASIHESIEAISEAMLEQNANLARQVFRGTRFLADIECRLAELKSNTPPDPNDKDVQDLS